MLPNPEVGLAFPGAAGGGLHLRGGSGTGCCAFWQMPETISPLTASPRELSFPNHPTPDPAFKFHPENSSPHGRNELKGNVPLHPRTRKGGRVVSQSSSSPSSLIGAPPPPASLRRKCTPYYSARKISVFLEWTCFVFGRELWPKTEVTKEV